MTKIYIDTNIFLDFYQASMDRLNVFEEIKKFSSDIILTEQTINEFSRNRSARLNNLANSIEKEATIKIYTTAIVQSLPDFSKWSEVKKEAEGLAKKISKQLYSLATDIRLDPVNTAFEELVRVTTIYQITQKNIFDANNRKLLGNPPTSPDKHTIGDEIIWEMILENIKDDLIIVSRDKTFSQNFSILKTEFETKTGHKLISITKSLAEAFDLLGVPSKAISKAEEEIVKTQKLAKYPYPLTLKTKCPSCGGKLEETGYEGSDGDSAWWVYCVKCHDEFFPDEFLRD